MYANVRNGGVITNLPDEAIVEVPCEISAQGLKKTHIGNIPIHLSALMNTNINVQSLCVEAIVTAKKEHVYHAAMLDPHTAAELSLSQIWDLVDDLLEAHGTYIMCF